MAVSGHTILRWRQLRYSSSAISLSTGNELHSQHVALTRTGTGWVSVCGLISNPLKGIYVLMLQILTYVWYSYFVFLMVHTWSTCIYLLHSKKLLDGHVDSSLHRAWDKDVACGCNEPDTYWSTHIWIQIYKYWLQSLISAVCAGCCVQAADIGSACTNS